MFKLKNVTKCIMTLMLMLLFVSPITVSAVESKDLSLSDLNVTASNELKETIETTVTNKMSYNDFLAAVESGQIESAFLEYTDYIYCIDNDAIWYEVPNPNAVTLKEILLLNDVDILTVSNLVTMFDIEVTQTATNTFSPMLWMFLLCIVIPSIFRAVIGVAMSKESQRVLAVKIAAEKKEQEKLKANSKKFDDVAGLKEVKGDMQTLVDFLVNGEKYREMGAVIPRGVLLYGPPGTGKTLLAKAIAGEAGVPFYYASGSDFTEKYVGVGAQRIRENFKKAKANAPSILFIDEIDAIGSKRGGDNENGEDRKTINALLTEMDGFEKTADVLVIGATNRLEDIDEALLRPGRFTNKYCVPLPESFEDRYTIIQLYAKNKRFMEDVDLKQLAKMTIGCSPAEIESILNEAAIIATRNGLVAIDNECIEDAFNKSVFKGHVRKDTFNRKKKELELVAWHEAGHALAGLLLGEDVNKVTILSSTTGAGGATFTIPKKMGLHSIEDLKKQIIGLYAGRCAELLYANGDKEQVTTGASNDIERATKLIYQMVSSLGMNEDIGMLNLNVMQMKDKSILDEASKLAKEMEDICIKLLKDNLSSLERIVELLLENETIYDKDMEFVTKRISLSEFSKATKKKRTTKRAEAELSA